MRKFYSEPELEIRNYSFFQQDILTTSSPETGDGEGTDLGDDDVFDPFA